jgi:3'(2'), 5'-bisphosphate nucleotidase
MLMPVIDHNLLEKIELLLQKAGRAILEVYGSSHFDETLKSDDSPVTRADHLSSLIINEGLRDLFPQTPVIDEESSIPEYKQRVSWPEFFMLDPLDGTREFIKKNGEFCINLALMRSNQPVASWIYQPLGNHGWSCVKGEGMRTFGTPFEPANSEMPEKTSKILRLVTSRSHISSRGLMILDRLSSRYITEVIKLGSALKQVYVALGIADLYIRGSGCSEWDTAAGHLMVEESGGLVRQWDMVKKLEYNKVSLRNPRFIMFSGSNQNTDLMDFIRDILEEIQ